MINFENTFHKLKNDFYADVIPSIPPKPELIAYNKDLAKNLNVNLKWLESSEGLECFSGSKVMKNSKCVIGNSSSGIREASFLGVPSVNIGTRQSNRERGPNVRDVNYNRNDSPTARTG